MLMNCETSLITKLEENEIQTTEKPTRRMPRVCEAVIKYKCNKLLRMLIFLCIETNGH